MFHSFQDFVRLRLQVTKGGFEPGFIVKFSNLSTQQQVSFICVGKPVRLIGSYLLAG